MIARMTKHINKHGGLPPYYCTSCSIELTEITMKKANTKRGFFSRCRRCINKAHQEHKMRRLTTEMKRASRMKQKYGLTLAQFDEMFYAQRGLCASCHEPFPSFSKMHIDHCHQTLRVRGLLCNDCNSAVGFMREDETRAIRLAGYIADYC